MCQHPMQSFGPSASGGERWTKKDMPTWEVKYKVKTVPVLEIILEKSAGVKYHGTSDTSDTALGITR